MAFDRPTLAALRERAKSQIQSRLGLGPLLVRSVLSVLGETLAGLAHGLHGHVAWAARQGLPTTADEEQLQSIASIYGIVRKPATFATGSITVTGVDGTVVPFRRRLKRADGVEYFTAATATIAAGSAAVPVSAAAEGLVGNAPAGTFLTFTAPVTGLASSTTVASPGLAGGADAEDTEDLRARVLQRTRQQPGAGNAADYVRWALEVPGVTRAWCFPRYPAVGSVSVAFTTDDEPSGPIPTPAKVAEVRAHIEALRPVTAQPLVFAPAPLPVNLSVVLTPNTPEVQASVRAALLDLLRRQGAPGEVLYTSHLREAISGASGEVDSTLITPTLDIQPERGQLPVLGSLGFQ